MPPGPPAEAARTVPQQTAPAEDADPCTHHGELIDILNATIAGLSHVQLRAELARYDMQPGDQKAPEDNALAAMLRSRPDLARAHRDRVLGPVLAIPNETWRRLLLDTLAAYLDSGGNAYRAAAAVFCHRNTVLNRLRTVERLTGRLLANPADVVDLVLALEAHALLGRLADGDGARRR